MPNFENIMKNYREVEVCANFFVLYKDEIGFLEGRIELDESFKRFILYLQEEIRYSWELEQVNMNDYLLFHIDTTDKNKLKEIKESRYYQQVRNSREIFIVLLHKDIQSRIIENLPLVYEWFMRIS